MIAAVAAAVGDGDDGAFHDAWIAAGDRLAGRSGERSARTPTAAPADALRRAPATPPSYHPLYGDAGRPAGWRRRSASRSRRSTRGWRCCRVPVAPLRIPFEGTTLPGVLPRPPRAGRARRGRSSSSTNGYDATVTEMYFASAVAAARRGYHCLFFDGPGQGAPLIEQGLRMRPDWETVIRPVVDFALTLPGHRPRRGSRSSGWSLGGYLALRGASRRAATGRLHRRPGRCGR